MTKIKLYTSKKFVESKNAIGIIEVIHNKDNYIIKSVMNGPLRVSEAYYILLLSAIRAMNGIRDITIFTPKNSLKLESDDDCITLCLLKQIVIDRKLEYNVENLDSEDIDKYVTLLTEAKQVLKNGMGQNTRSSTEKSS